MPRFAANLSTMYNDVPFMERFARAAADGFVGVEFLFPYDYEPAELKKQLDQHGLTHVLFNAPPGDWGAGERGLASLPGREGEFVQAIEKALGYATVLECKTVHVMAGNIVPLVLRERQRAVFLANLARAADMAAAKGVTIVLEPINHRNMPLYFLERQDEGQAIVAELGRENVAVQFDIYHCQVAEGDVATRLRRDLPHIGHIQIAGVPDRHEPDKGELNYEWLFHYLDEIGYKGWIGCEYNPAGDTSQGLGWFKPWRDKQKTSS
ncbi:MAG: hydroxypyruvate isomerase family protein [Methylobacteriaceae bacterium]|jgi:hydroxypyruvate isomerase|nr:hydroxypyruvate isomerase family protein [Methylobacteriaceae bacterium]